MVDRLRRPILFAILAILGLCQGLSIHSTLLAGGGAFPFPGDWKEIGSFDTSKDDGAITWISPMEICEEEVEERNKLFRGDLPTIAVVAGLTDVGQVLCHASYPVLRAPAELLLHREARHLRLQVIQV